MYDIAPGEEKQLYNYLPTSLHDWILIDLWKEMQKDQSLQKIMTREAQSLLSFCSFLAKSTTHFAIDREGPYFCLWQESFLSGIAVGIWVRGDKRVSQVCLSFIHDIFNKIFQNNGVIITVTRSPETNTTIQHFGFAHACTIPSLYDGDTAYISYLTKENYETEQIYTLNKKSNHTFNITDITQYLAEQGKQ